MGLWQRVWTRMFGRKMTACDVEISGAEVYNYAVYGLGDEPPDVPLSAHGEADVDPEPCRAEALE
jgi:hypothetical protein